MKTGVDRSFFGKQCCHWRGYTKAEVTRLRRRLAKHPEEDYGEIPSRTRIYCQRKHKHNGAHRDETGKRWRAA